MSVVLAALGAAIGAPLRYLAGHWWDRRTPWGTLTVNVTGSFLLGLFTALALSGAQLAFLGAGFCGGLTTWSSLAVQSVDRGPRHGGGYLALTLVLSFAAVTAGFALAG